MAEIIKHVPADKVDRLMQDYRDDGAISVKKIDEGNGLFTVIAEYPSDREGEPVGAAAPADAASTGAVAATTTGAVPPVGARAAAIDTLARTIWGEARGEPREGKEAVAAVVVNRLRRGPAGRFGNTVEACCRMPKHFSCWNEEDVNRPQLLAVTGDDAAFRECVEIATLAIDGRLPDRTSGCDHYHTRAVAPEWSRGKQPKVTIGSHLFFDNIA